MEINNKKEDYEKKNQLIQDQKSWSRGRFLPKLQVERSLFQNPFYILHSNSIGFWHEIKYKDNVF